MGDYFQRGAEFLEQAVEMTPWARGGLVIAVVLGLVFAYPVAQLLRSNPVVVGLLITVLLAVLVFTLTPHPRVYGSADVCLMTLTRPSRADLVEPTDISLNLLLFLPVGVLVMLLRPLAVMIGFILFALLLPVIIEYTQYAIGRLGRTCSLYDIATNELGLIIGLAIGVVVRAIWEVIARIGKPNTYAR